MKNLKKILALALAFVMCFTMFASAKVFSDVPAGGDYSQAITFLSDLGVIAGKPDGTFGVNDAITRADAACLIARLMTGETNPPKSDGSIRFTDVGDGDYFASSVNYCVSLGITVGTGNGQFSPKRTITDGEFIAMLTRAMGYDTAEHPLSFPMGNITTAQQRGLLYGVNVEYASDALRGEDAQMLYNAMFAEYDRAAANKNTFQAADDHWDVTIAEEVFGLGRLAHDNNATDDSRIGSGLPVSFHGANRNTNPTVNCDAHTWVIAGVDARNNDNTYVAFAIDDKDVKAISPEDRSWSYQEFTYDGDITPLLGYRVELWGEYDHSNPVWDVSAIKVVDGNMTGSRASASAFQSRYDANQAMYTYTPDMFTNDNRVVIDGKTLHIQNDGNIANAAKINLDINTADRFMWATETQNIVAGAATGLQSYVGHASNPAISSISNNTASPYGNNAWNNTFAAGLYTRNSDAYRLAFVSARDNIRNPLNNAWVHINFADGDQYKLFDWDGDDYIDFVVADTAKYAEVTTKTSSRMVLEADERNIAANNAGGDTLAIRSRGSYSLDLSDDNLKVEGAESIEEGDVVEITLVSRVHTRGDGEVVTIKLTKVEPEVKKLEKVNVTRQEYTFGGEVIELANVDFFDRVELSAGGQSREDLDTIENIGKEFNLWFDRNGFLIKARVNDDSASGYLMILETLDGQNNLHTSSVAARRNLAVADVLFDDNTVGKEVEFVANLTIDNNNDGSTGYTRTDRSWNERMVVGNVYKYYMNDDNQITRLTSATAQQGANYNFDDSKDRLGVSSGTASRNYGFTDDAVVFAVKQNGRSFVQSKRHDAGQGSGGAIGGSGDPTPNITMHYWVDQADVMAVSIDDVPEIDNRVTGLNWTKPSYDVTHPARFIDVDVAAANNFAPLDVAAGTALPYEETTTLGAGRWIQRVAGNGTWNDNLWDTTAFDNAVPVAVSANTNSVIPSVAFDTNRDGEIEAAIFGVDSLQFFGAGSIKLALISNVYAVGNKTYEFKAAIDGKYDTFKTISAEEDDIFKGNLGEGTGNTLSYQAMRTYLNQTVDGYTGARNALYAEVVMNSDGLIREVRAMSVVTPTGTNTYWGNDPVRTQFMEGNVYRVIRGVTTQLLSKNLVTWQASPRVFDANRRTLYWLSKYDDNNEYDHMEASYDEDTKFYDISQDVRMITDQPTLVGMGFSGNIDGDIKAADSGVLEASMFADDRGSSLYHFYDFVVYKNDMSRLASVFRIEDHDITNGTAKVDTGVVPTTLNNAFDVNAVSGAAGTATGAEVSITIPEDVDHGSQANADIVVTIDGTDYNIPVAAQSGGDLTARIAARAIQEACEPGEVLNAVATAKRVDNVVTLTLKGTAAGANKVVSVRGIEAKVDVVTPGKGDAAASVKAQTDIVVKDRAYSLSSAQTVTFTIVREKDAADRELAKVDVTVPNGVYTANQIANMIADAVNAKEVDKLSATVSGGTVVVTHDPAAADNYSGNLKITY